MSSIALRASVIRPPITTVEPGVIETLDSIARTWKNGCSIGASYQVIVELEELETLAAEYIAESARRVAEGFPLETLGDMPYEEAHRKLMELPGVGPKVADCVLLFGCGHLSAYPVDVWVARLSRAWLGIDEKNGARVAETARARFGRNAGILQQYLFHCARCGLMT